MPVPYTVERGDTLSQIAATNGLTLKQLLTVNPGITNPNEIYAGQDINLPGVPQTTTTSAPLPQPGQPAGGTLLKTVQQKLMDQIIMDEVSGNIRLNAHPDPIHGDKVPTIGIGTTRQSPGAITYLLSKNYDPDKVFKIGEGSQAITEADARAMTNLAFNKNESFLKKTFPSYSQWPEPAQIGLQNQLYQLGPTSFMGFKNMVNALRQDKVNWGSVADHGFDSKWATQTPNRAKRVTDQIRSADTWKPPTPTPPKATTPLPAETTHKAGHYLYPTTAICASNMAKDLKPN